MGAANFGEFHMGSNLDRTFRAAVKDALYGYGHRGYTGSIAEKHSVELRGSVTTLKEAKNFANDDLDENDHDKWGPAWAVEITGDPKGFYFYGWASC